MKPSQLFDSADQWCQGPFAMDANGVGCQSTAPEAVRWCLIGRYSYQRQIGKQDFDYEALVRSVSRAATELYPEIHPLCRLAGINENPGMTFEKLQAILKLADTYYESNPTVLQS